MKRSKKDKSYELSKEAKAMGFRQKHVKQLAQQLKEIFGPNKRFRILDDETIEIGDCPKEQ
jgi:hypothetical protein